MLLNYELESAFDELTTQIKDVFVGKQGHQNAKKYLTGLLSKTERKNNWQIAETIGETTPYALQQFIYRGKYSPDKLKNHLQTYVTEKLGDPNATYVIDETGFLKKGNRSCGVKRQYSGTAGKVENCQIGVFLTYAGTKGHTPIDRRLYMPKDWCDDSDRRKKAGVLILQL
jgi:SRSO17 transposase